MKYQALRWLRLSLGLLLFAAGGGQPGGFDLVAQQIPWLSTQQLQFLQPHQFEHLSPTQVVQWRGRG